MSEKDTHETHRGRAESGSSSKALTIVIIFCFLGILPLLVWVTIPEESPYVSVTTSSAMVQTAAASAGLQVCSTDAVATTVPGATSAVLYRLSPSCDSMNPAAVVQVMVVGFSSSDAQDAAIAEAQVTYYNWQTTNTAAVKSGYNVIVVHGEPRNEAVSEISSSLIEQGAVRLL